MAKFKDWEPVSANTVKVAGEGTSNPKKLTGTRLGKVLGLNKWGTPFSAWCEIMRVAEPPFEGNKYTEAGNAIEPKLLEFCKVEVSPYIVTPEEWFKTSQKVYDHFPTQPIFGGMWDALVLDAPLSDGGQPIAVIEAKTSSRPQDWEYGVPDSYAVQGLMYAYLLGVERVFFPVAFLEPSDYDNPEDFEVTDDNTFVYELSTEHTIVNGQWAIHEAMSVAEDWHHIHCDGNISPEFDEKRDKDYLAIMRKSEVKSEPLALLAKQATALNAQIESIREEMCLDTLEKELEGLKKQMKSAMMSMFNTTDETVTSNGWQLKKTTRSSIDKEGLKADGLLEQYTVASESYTLTKEKN